ncbi:hypothetical protein NPIL_89191 [Nephila pilipes]|uniref:Uncharacterized protein n=1 Tax=Nephila pilipes TaxID=299642 RepID=A0A8X6QMY9_NEPPI|nr:hypothetical protein NPIL_89191 [Nephila pilipes]
MFSKDKKAVIGKPFIRAQGPTEIEETSETLVTSPSANRSIIDEDDGINLVSPPVKRSKCYNPHVNKP